MAKNCWRLSNSVCLFEEVNQLSAIDVFIFVSSLLSADDLGRFCMVAWAIWENRNKHYMEGKSKPPELVISGALDLLA